MKFGLYLPNQGPFADVRFLVELARGAEDTGWDGFFIWDALVPIFEHAHGIAARLGTSRDVADAFVALAAVAAATTRIRLGALVTPLARHQPETIAQQAVTLDHLSGGRLTLGVGLGSPELQFEAFGGSTDLRVRAAIVDEALDVMTRLWRGEEIDHRGPHFTATGISMHPRPVQQPRIPIWIGAGPTAAAPRRRAARWDGCVPASESWPDGLLSIGECRALSDGIAAVRSATAPFDLVLIGDGDGRHPEPAEVPAYEAAGVTWILIQVLSPDGARARIAAGRPA